MMMNKQDFMTELEKHLKERNVSDFADILIDYEQHFLFKLADGYTEDEISAKLGQPLALAAQYTAYNQQKRKGRGGIRFAAALGLFFLNMITSSAILAFLAWVIALGISTIGFLAAGLTLLAGLNPAELLPYMPRTGEVIISIVLLSLTTLAAMAAIYCWRFVIQITKANWHWNGRCLAKAGNRPVKPSIAATPQFTPSARRVMRRITSAALVVFAISLIAGYIVLALRAGAWEFWHVWGWFV
jgi:hypothetical protein